MLLFYQSHYIPLPQIIIDLKKTTSHAQHEKHEQKCHGQTICSHYQIGSVREYIIHGDIRGDILETNCINHNNNGHQQCGRYTNEQILFLFHKIEMAAK